MRRRRMSSKRVMGTFDVLFEMIWPDAAVCSWVLMGACGRSKAIGQNWRPSCARAGSTGLGRPATGESQRNTMQHHDPVGTREGEVEAASDALKSRLTTAENVLATLAVDLDDELRFSSGLVALTDHRLLARD